MKLKILKNFRSGSVSNPQQMIAGNTVEIDVSEKRLAKWIEKGWVEKVGVCPEQLNQKVVS